MGKKIFFGYLIFLLYVSTGHGTIGSSISKDKNKTSWGSKEFVNQLNYNDYQSPDFARNLAFFMDSVIAQQPDTVFDISCLLIDKCASDTLCRRWMLEFLFNRAIESPVPWMENVWVKLAEQYYLKQPSGNEDPGWIERLRYTVKLKRNCLIGEKAVLFTALTPNGEKLDIKGLSGKYMVICFYDPDCTHCKEAIPHLHKLYKKYNRKDLSVVAFNISDDSDLWNSFIRKHQLQDWANVWDPDRDISEYDSFYDTPLSPSFYILDAERRIISKDMEIGEVETFLSESLSSKH